MSGYAWPAWRRPAASVGRTVVEVGLGAAAAAVVGLLLGHKSFYALLLPAGLGAIWLVVRPRPAAALLGASIAAVQTITSGGLQLNISGGDLLLLLLVLAAVGAAVLERDATTFRALRPVAFPVLQYCLFVLLLLFAHPGFGSLVQTLQRYELIAFPILIGSYLALKGVHLTILRGYVIASAVLAVVHPFDSLGIQKNPAGQFVANAILLVIGVPRLGRYRILLPLLVYGLFATESRGAIVACGVGVAVLLALRWMHSPRQALATAAAAAAVAVLVFEVMPAGAQSFITTYGSQGSSHAAWNIRYRQQYQREALSIIRAHPWLGVGVGSYGNATAAADLPPVSDPHEVVLLQAAEGGWGLAASYVVLILLTAFALVRLREVELAAAGAAVLLATAVHGLVDVYWVRGTPVLGWLLVGIVCATAREKSPRELESA